MYSVSSCWLTFFFSFFFWFSSVSTQEVPCYHLFPERAQLLPGLLPTWPPLASSCPLLSRPITFVPGEQAKCLPACCLSTSSAPSFPLEPPSQDLPRVQPFQFSMVPSLGSGVGSCMWLHRRGPAFWTRREGAHAILTHSGQQLCNMASKTGQVRSSK